MKDFASFSGGGDAWQKDAERTLAQYAGKSEGEIVRAIYDRAVEGKRNGTLTNEQLDAFYAQFSAMLEGAKRKRLKKLVDELKRM